MSGQMKMDEELLELITLYATKPRRELEGYLSGKSKEKIAATLIDVLVNYFNDKNSSSLREYVTVSLCGYELSHKKIGYNGYKQNSIGGEELHCEAKPKNINTNDKNKKKLDGNGNFSDYTWERFARDKAANPMMLVSGFINGRLIYIFQFPFNAKTFTDNLRNKLKNVLPQGDKTNIYVRSAGFNLASYKNAKDLEIKTFVDKPQLEGCKEHLTKGIYEILANG